MKLSKIYIHPIKSLRPVECDSAILTPHGLAHDRRFMMMKRSSSNNSSASRNKPAHENSCPGWTNMAITENNQMVRFLQSVRFPSTPEATDGLLTVTYKPVATNQTDSADEAGGAGGAGEERLQIPLTPAVAALEPITITMHKSPTRAYQMPADVNSWFSRCFGFEAMLIYLGPHRRPVLSSVWTHPAVQVDGDTTAPLEADPTMARGGVGARSWFSAASGFAASLVSRATALMGPERPRLTFTDCAPLLVVSAKSMEDVSARLPPGEEFDITKFRANLVVEGADEFWEEDYWAELRLTASREHQDDDGEADRAVTLHCLHNCVRCVSINIDYDTGRQGLGESGKMLKFLSRDRRVDPGAKYSPVFGRYTFLEAACDGKVIRVGDEVQVTKRNSERTITDWPS